MLTAVRLATKYDVVGISAKPALVSGQELGIRLAEPELWKRNYLCPFSVLRGLDGVRRVHGVLAGVDLVAREVQVRSADGEELVEPYNVLVVSTGVTNGFWRRPDLESPEQVEQGLQETHRQLAEAASIAVVGGGAAAVSCAANAARVWPDKQVDLYFPRDRALTEHHRRVWDHVRTRLEQYGVGLHPGHRAEVPVDFATDRITHDPLRWSTGQPRSRPDAVHLGDRAVQAQHGLAARRAARREGLRAH